MTNSSESTGTFRRKLTSADASNIVTVLDLLPLNGQYSQFEADYILGFAGMLESLQVSVGLFSLKPADFPNITPLMSEAQKQAELARIRTDGQKMGLSLWVAKGNGPWEYVSECVLQNNANSESYVPLLVPFLTVNEVLLIDRDFRLGVKVETKWQGPLKINDYLIISGSWRQRVTFTAKKNELELVLADIEALKLALYGRLTDLPAGGALVGSATGGVAGAIALPLPVALGGTGLSSTPTFKGAKSSSQAITSGIPTKIILNSELGDSNNQYDAANSRLVANGTETWAINVFPTLEFNISPASETARARVLFYVYKNGADFPGVSRILDWNITTGYAGISLFIPEFPLVAGDYLEMYCLVLLSGGNINVYGDINVNATYWSGKRIK